MHSVAAPSNGRSDTPNSVAAPLQGEQKVSRTNFEAPIPDSFPKPAAGRAAEDCRCPDTEEDDVRAPAALWFPATDRKEKLERVLKEGRKRGREIKDAADIDNLEFFCTSVDEPNGDIEMLIESMNAMNGDCKPDEKEQKVCSSHICKMIFSAGISQVAIVAYIPSAYTGDVDGKDWLEFVVSLYDGEIVKQQGNLHIGKVDANPDKRVFPLKIQEFLIQEASYYHDCRHSGIHSDTAADEQSEEESLLSPSNASSSVDHDENWDEGQLLDAGGGVCDICPDGMSLRCVGPCKLVDSWFADNRTHYAHCRSCLTAAQALDDTARRVLLYRLAVRDHPDSWRANDTIWDLVNARVLHVPMDLKSPAEPAVVAAQAGSLASIWVDYDEDSCEDASSDHSAAQSEHGDGTSSSHNGSEEIRPQSPSSTPTSVQSLEIDADEVEDTLTKWYLDSNDAGMEIISLQAAAVRLPVCAPQSHGEYTRRTPGTTSTYDSAGLV